VLYLALPGCSGAANRRDLWYSDATTARRGSVRGVREIAAGHFVVFNSCAGGKGLALNTLSAYRRDLAKFEDFAKKRKLALAAVKRDDLVDFLASLYRQKLESKTVARQLVTLRIFSGTRKWRS